MHKRPLTPTYIFFYLLFWPDTWRIVIGLAAAFLLEPRITGFEGNLVRTGMVFIMLAVIGYAVSPKPARFISAGLRKAILRRD